MLVFAFCVSAKELTGYVISVNDGDTLTLHVENMSVRVRLSGIDAPELSQPFGIESRDALRQDVLNQTVTVETNKSDRYGRRVGKVALNNEDINLRQIRRGLAWVYTDYIKELSAEDRELYIEAEKAANDDHIGLWQEEQPVAPWKYRKSK